jgi:ABC-type Fe3+ transport system permease subunit
MQRQRVTWTSGVLGVLFCVVVGALVALPAVALWQWFPAEIASAASWRHLLLDPGWLDTLSRSLAVTLFATGLASIVAVPVAFAADRGPAGVRGLLLVFALLAFVTPPFVLALPLQALVADLLTSVPGTLNDAVMATLVVTYALHYAPILVLGLSLGLHRRDIAQTEAARTHGVSDVVAWYRVTLPQLTPAYVLGLTLVALRILSDASVPMVLGTETLLSVTVFREIGASTWTTSGAQAAIALVLLNATLVVIAWRLLTPPVMPNRSRPIATRGMPLPTLLTTPIALGLFSAPLLWLAWQAHGQSLSLGAVDAWLRSLDVTLPLMGVAGLTLALLGTPAALLTQQPNPLGRMIRQLLPVLLILPAPLLAAGLLGTASVITGPDQTGAFVYIVSGGLAISVPLLAVAPHLGALLTLHSGREIADLARCFGSAPARPLVQLLLPGLLASGWALFLIGSALALLDVSTHPILRSIGTDPLAVELMQQVRAGTAATTWAPLALALASATAVLLTLAALLVDRRSRHPMLRAATMTAAPV